MVTFTKDAAEEMRKRLIASLSQAGMRPPGDERLIVATFHSIAIRHLFKHRPKFRVLSPQAQDVIYRDAAAGAGVDRDSWGDVQKQFERYMYAVDRSQVVMDSETTDVIRRYERLVHGTGQVDLFTVMRDCALYVADGTIPPLRYTDMLVDEGQDTDDLQRLWIFSHAKAGCRVTIVGDDDQSIYEWRNALGYEGMRSFLETFHAHRIELGDNFRCRSEILAPAALLIGQNRQRLGKHLVARRGRGGALAGFRAAGCDDQNESLARLIAQTREQHAKAAVLARTNRSLDPLELVLRGEGIEYVRAGKSIWQTPVIAGYLALLQTLIDGSPTGLLTVLQVRGVSDSVRSDLLLALRGNVSSLLDGQIPSLENLDATDKATLKAVASDCSYWRRQLRASHLGGSVREVILEVGQEYARWSKGLSAAKLVDLCSRILADLTGTLSSRLMFVTRKNRDISAAPLVLMTMHGAKGLEFETVHVIDASKTDDGSDVVNPEAERRLMYVALTRAKNCCVVWFSGEIHPAVKEAQIPQCRTAAELLSLVRAAK